MAVLTCTGLAPARGFEQPAALPQPSSKPTPDSTTGAPQDQPASFMQDVPGAAFKFEMRPVPASADGAIKPFFIGATELTWEAFDIFIYRLDEEAGPAEGLDAVTRPSKPYLPPDRGFGHDGFAAISMSHNTATEYCKWLSVKTGKKYRLPTEAEWEHACRAGATTAYCSGDDASKLGDYAWFLDNAAESPHAVKTKQPNAWGLFDMHGNIAEWCDSADGKPVTKGGSYRDPAPKLTAAARELPSPAWNASDPQIPKSKFWLADAPFVGFRVVCEVESTP